MDSDIARARALDAAVTAVCEWLGWERDQFFVAADRWDQVRDSLWEQSTPVSFYTAWTADAGQVAVCRNLIDQASRAFLFNLYEQIFAQAGDAESYLDYGCGSGLLSYTFLDHCRHAVLCDVPNFNQDFLRWRLERHGPAHAAVVTPDDVALLPEQTFTFIACIDVLEHLANATEVFVGLHRLLRVGGLMLHRSPWAREGEDFNEHLPEATADWHRPGGGRDLLARDYNRVVELDHGGLYQRLR